MDTLNLKNLKSEFGIIILTGLAKFLEFPKRKDIPAYDWAEDNGMDYMLNNVVFEDKEVTLSLAITADTTAEFWDYYNAFFAEITQAGWQNLYIHDHDKTYEVFYKSTSDFKLTLKRLKNVEKVFVKFNLTVQVK